MRIAVVAEFFFPSIGGHEQRLLEVLEVLSKQGHEVEVYTIRYSSDLAIEETYKGIKIKRIYDDFNYKGGGGLKSRSIKTIIIYSYYVNRILCKMTYDKIFYTQFPIFHIMLSKICLNKSRRILDFVEYRNSMFWEFIFSLEGKCADKIICISNSVKKNCEAIMENSKLEVIPSSIKLEKFNPNINKEYFIFIGRMESHKHPEDAIIAVIEYNKQYGTNYSIHLVGDGSLLGMLKEKYKHNPMIIFHGFVSEAEKIKIMEKGLLHIFPSEREGLPVSVIESMATGIPTLTTDYPNNGTKEFVADYGVGVVTSPKINDITTGIHEILENISEYRLRCKHSSNEFSSENAANKFLTI